MHFHRSRVLVGLLALGVAAAEIGCAASSDTPDIDTTVPEGGAPGRDAAAADGATSNDAATGRDASGDGGSPATDAGAVADAGDAGSVNDAGSATDAADAGAVTDASDAGSVTDASDAGAVPDASDAGAVPDASDAGSAVDAGSDADADAGAAADASIDAADAALGPLAFAWTITPGSATGDQTISAVAVDAATGDVAITGVFEGTLDFGGGSTPLVAATRSIFVVELDRGGKELWGASFAAAAATPAAIAVSPADGSVAVAGSFTGSVDLGSGALVAASAADLFVADYDGSGHAAWSKRFGTSGTHVPVGAAFSSGGDLKLVVADQGVIDFGGGALTTTTPSVVVARFAATGASTFSQAFSATGGSGGGVVPFAAATDGLDELAIVASVDGTVDFGCGALTSAGTDALVALLEDDESCYVSKNFGDASDQRATSVVVDDAYDLVVGGDFAGTIDLGTTKFTAKSTNDAFVASLDGYALGEVYSVGFGNGTPLGAPAVAYDGLGRTNVVVDAQGTIDLGLGAQVGPNAHDTRLGRYDGVAGAALQDGLAPAFAGAPLAAGASDGTTVIAGTTVDGAGHQHVYLAKIAQ